MNPGVSEANTGTFFHAFMSWWAVAARIGSPPSQGTTSTSGITGAVVNGTYTLHNLAAGASQIIRLTVRVKSSAHVGATASWLVTTRSLHDSTRADAAKASVRVISG